jgi:hypothetical protein
VCGSLHKKLEHEEWHLHSGMLRRVALVRTNVSEELSASFIRVTRIGELGTTLAVTLVLTRATRRNIPEDVILHSHCRENLKSYQLKQYYRVDVERKLSLC